MKPSEQIDKYISDLNDWRGEMVINLRKIIHEADSEIVEEWKWDTPVFTENGMVCAIGVFKDHVKLNFFKGVLLSDPHKLINAGFDSKAHRSINFSEGSTINESVLRELVYEAILINNPKKKI